MSKVFSSTDYTNAQARAALLTRINWAAYSLRDSSVVSSVNWNSRTLVDPSGVVALNWNGRELADASLATVYDWNSSTFTPDQTFSGKIIAGNTVRLKGFTVATLPAGTQGDLCFATDLLGPAYLVAAVGGGAVVGPVFYTGAAWVCA